MLGPGRVVQRRPGPPHGQRVPLLDARPAERRDARRGQGAPRSSRPARTASTPSPTSTRSSAGVTRSSTTPSCSADLVDRGSAHAGRAGEGKRHLPRPVLPRPAQPGLHTAARGARVRARPHRHRDAALQGARLLLRRRRRAHVDGGAHRQAHQHRARRRGAVAGPGRRVDRLPVLPGDAGRRGDREAGRRRGEVDVVVIDVAQVLARSVRGK